MEEEDTLSVEFDSEENRKVPKVGRGRIGLLIFHRFGVKLAPLMPDQSLVIGRQPPVDVLVPDKTLSRQHTRFDYRDGKVTLEDLGSTNGTRVDGRPLKRKEALGINQDVTLGNVTVTLREFQSEESPLHRVVSHERFIGILEEEVPLTRFFKYNLAVALVKAVDTRSPHVGHWLTQFRKLLRPIDNLALYSHDCVELLMPDVTADQARTLLRDVIADSGHELPLLMCGVAMCPGQANTPFGLLEASKDALQHATPEQPIFFADNDGIRSIPVSDGSDGGASELVVTSPAMKAVFDDVDRLARSKVPVLIYGETGTGKEVVARELHDRSQRRSKPMCCINCAALPEHLVESTLFGHERGAFTGADRTAEGMFQAADGGTLLLDEIGELPLQAQAALLRVLETGAVTRIGSTKERSVDVRIIAATNRKLDEMIASGSFRSDLYYRIDTATISLPPLRERTEEVEPLVMNFIRRANRDSDCRVERVHAAALADLKAYAWPGNIRELKNVIERAAVLVRGSEITTEDLADRVRNQVDLGGQLSLTAVPNGAGESSNRKPLPTPSDMEPIVVSSTSTRQKPHEDSTVASEGTFTANLDVDYKEGIEKFESELIRHALDMAEGNKTRAAKRINMPLRTFLRKVKKFGLD